MPGPEAAVQTPGLAGDPGVGVGGEGSALLVAEVYGVDAQVFTGHDDVEVGAAHEVEEGVDALLLESSGDEVASGDGGHVYPP